MSYAAKATTNNKAENIGLLTGLTACRKYGYSPVHVVGDSAMIITQQRERKPPRAAHLAPLYWSCQRQAAGCKVLSW
jgi:ribonuclease HI